MRERSGGVRFRRRARGRLSRLPVVAGCQPRTARAGRIRGAGRSQLLPRGCCPRLGAHVDPARTIACEFTGTHPTITHTHFGALRLKDGICDRLRDQTGTRPDIARIRPAVRVLAHAAGSRITLSIDLAGEGLHRRGYRSEAGEAPLRENLAAGILLRARWDEAAARGAEFLDPLCGSGTLVIEAAHDRRRACARTATRLLRLQRLAWP